MLNEFTTWAAEIMASFDWSDLFAFIAGCLAMVAYKNFQAVKWNRSKESGGDRSVMGTEDDATTGIKIRGRKINLPALNKKFLIWFVVAASMIGIMFSTYQTGRDIRQNVAETRAVSLAVCENAKVSGVERKALQDLLLASMNQPPEIKNLPQDDPVRQEWGRKLALTYLGALEDAAKQRKAISEGKHLDPDFWERYFGPDYPEPDCFVPVN
jgi:hypothetical protein